MQVLLVGATGYIGSAVARALLDRGHAVVPVLRPGADDPATPDGATAPRRADLLDPRSLVAAVTADVDAVVHAGAPLGPGVDESAVGALLAPLRGSGRAFLYLSGAWVLGSPGDVEVDEASPPDPLAVVAHRPAVERMVLASAQAVRGLVLRPGVVHGHGGGIPALLVDRARRVGHGQYVGRPTRWPMVHVDDLALLAALAVEVGVTGSVLHGVAEPAVRTDHLAAAAADAAGLPGAPVGAWSLEEAGLELGRPFAEALAVDLQARADRTRDALGWQPRSEGAVADLAGPSYRLAETVPQS